MSRSDDERIADILEAAEQVARVVERSREAWDSDRIAQLAVERLLEIIGESARWVLDDLGMAELAGLDAQAMSKEARSAYPRVPWSDVIGLRVVLAHHYHRVDPGQVWNLAATEVPRLAKQLG